MCEGDLPGEEPQKTQITMPDEVPVQFLCEDVDLAGQIGVGLKLEFLSFKVVVGFGLLEGGLPVLADHDERRQKDRIE